MAGNSSASNFLVTSFYVRPRRRGPSGTTEHLGRLRVGLRIVPHGDEFRTPVALVGGGPHFQHPVMTVGNARKAARRAELARPRFPGMAPEALGIDRLALGDVD